MIPQRLLPSGALRSKAGDGPHADLDALEELLATHVPHALVGHHLCTGLAKAERGKWGLGTWAQEDEVPTKGKVLVHRLQGKEGEGCWSPLTGLRCPLFT